MRIVRYALRNGAGSRGGNEVRDQVRDQVRYGVLDDQKVHPLDGLPFGSTQPTAEPPRRLSEVVLLAPVEPSKVIGVGRNYVAHAAELGNEVPDEPLIFFKPPSSVIGPGDAIVHPDYSQELHHEAELAVVIRTRCRKVLPEQVADVILGYTCANDVTARDLQKPDKQWWRAKGSDTFCPLGPWVETELDTTHLEITATVDGETRQRGSTDLMVHGVTELVSHVSNAMTLLPGDVILTGTPAGVGPLRPGNQVTIAVEGLGELTNQVVDGR